MSSVLLTGATGFLGGELHARWLERTDRDVITLIRAPSDAAALASSIDSRKVAPAANAQVMFAVTESPAPTTSISPRIGRAGTWTVSPEGGDE